MSDHVDIHIIIVALITAILVVLAFPEVGRFFPSISEFNIFMKVLVHVAPVLLFVTPMTLTRAFDRPYKDSSGAIIIVNLGIATLIGVLASCVTFIL